jgi:hypothetical protein
LLFLGLLGLGLPALLMAMCYAVIANVCYSLGAPAELVAKVCWKEKAQHTGPVLLTLGTIFSI